MPQPWVRSLRMWCTKAQTGRDMLGLPKAGSGSIQRQLEGRTRMAHTRVRRAGVPGGGPALTDMTTRTPAPWHGGAQKIIVEARGIEPLSYSAFLGLLRAQPVALFSALAITQASRQ